MRRGLEPAFVPVLDRVGAVLIEAWIEGVMLDSVGADAWTSTAGALLGRLHGRRLEPSAPGKQSTARWNEAAAADLALLREAQALSTAESEVVRSALRCHDPGRARIALIHKDFCAENMLIDERGQLRIIDTEILAVEPVGFDVAWTWHRWPMSSGSWARFMDAYRSASAIPEAWEYWRLVTGLTLARVCFQRIPARFDAHLERLLRCAATAAGEKAAAP